MSAPPPRSRVPVREPEVAELRAFCAAAMLGSIAEAARAMNVSQPAMSKRLKGLEAVVGSPLFERSTRGVTLTPSGLKLYAAARRLLISADTVQALISNVHTPEPVRIAASPTAAELWLGQLLADLSVAEGGLAAEVVTANSIVVRRLVSEARCGLGIVALDPYVPSTDGLQERALWRDEVLVFVPAGHPWQELAEIPLTEFVRTPLIERDRGASSSRLVTSTLEQSGMHREAPAFALGSTEALIRVAIATRTPALLSGDVARTHLDGGHVLRRVDGMHFKREFALVWSGHLLDLPAAVQTIARHALELPFLAAAGGLG